MKVKKRCKYSYALAVRSGNSAGAHSTKKFKRTKQSTADLLDEWWEEENEKDRQNNDGPSFYI